MDERAYDFRTAAQWSAGARSNLRVQGDVLAVPARLAVENLAGTGRADAGALLAVDTRGELLWLRPRTRELVGYSSWGVTEEGILDGPVPARLMVAGPGVVWVHARGTLERYQRTTRQRLTPAAPRPGWRIAGATGDATDGLWLVEGDHAGHWRLRHVDCWGQTCRDPIPIDAKGEPVIAATTDGTRLVTLDPVTNTATIRDAATGQVTATVPLDPAYRGESTMATVDADNRLHLLGANVYQSLHLADCGVEDRQELRMPLRLGRAMALAAARTGLVVACTGGVGRIAPHDGGNEGRRSTFITPALVSPLGVRSGWNRAVADLSLSAGTTIEFAWAATNDASLVERATALLAGPASAGRTDALEALLPWREEEAVVYRGTDGGGTEVLAALLDEVAETTLWLRLRLVTPPGRTPPRIHRLRVRYPADSLIDQLPAIYREQARSAHRLRSVLAPYEVLLDGLDETLAALPGRIDPEIAPDNWTAYLLSWLGFPPLADLPPDRRRELLVRAGDLLAGRGTRAGLELLLGLVTEGRSTVNDAATDSAGWFLGTPSARLGHDTIVLGQMPAPARPGSMVLGDTPLGAGCPDPARMLAHRAGVVTIDLELDPERQRVLAPIIDRLLPVFVPAHCRVRLRYTGTDGRSRSRLLDADLRLGPDVTDREPPPYGSLLHSDAHWRLSTTTRLGRWSLSRPQPRSVALDDAPGPGAGPRLQ
ncbi:hypothetical protein [Couchioplanes caeruleus]|uniref:hypothetical protein n=1 Tax=Couchioplanes caeruleus TaxID=56438 RepID=UPI0011601765|nr:hypothetical protein [Couchioplanes caeruleus]